MPDTDLNRIIPLEKKNRIARIINAIAVLLPISLLIIFISSENVDNIVCPMALGFGLAILLGSIASKINIKNWEILAEQLGLDYQPKGNSNLPEIFGEYKGRELKVFHIHLRLNRYSSILKTHFTVRLENPTEEHIKIQSRDRKISHQIRTGDEDLDQQLIIVSSDKIYNQLFRSTFFGTGSFK